MPSEMATAEEEYALFKQKVKRTVYIDNLSPLATEPVLRAALDQFGNVKNVDFIPSYIGPKMDARCALVEMKDEKQAAAVVELITDFPFMISGMPRPVRARPAEAEMFDDRPRKPGRTIECRWLGPDDPDFQLATKMKRLSRLNAAEISFFIKHQLNREEKLAKQQNEALKTNYKKFEFIESITGEKDKSIARNLAIHYGMHLPDDP